MSIPAFPQPYVSPPDGDKGMTLRDYFATHAPEPPASWRAKKDDAENIIVWRWAYADAMMEARK